MLSAIIIFMFAILAAVCFIVQVISKSVVGVSRALISAAKDTLEPLLSAISVIVMAFVLYGISYFLSGPRKALANIGSMVLVFLVLVVLIGIILAVVKQSCIWSLIELIGMLILYLAMAILGLLGGLGQVIYNLSQKGYEFALGKIQAQMEKSVMTGVKQSK